MPNKKNIIIIGAGEIGTNAASKLVKQGHDVTVIEHNAEKLEALLNNIDVKTVLGNGCLPKNLEAAGAKNADVLLALTSSDEVNFVASQVAYSIFNTKVRMARVYHQEYLDDSYKTLFNDKDLAVDYVLSPAKLVAEKIVTNLKVPQSFDYSPLAGDELVFLGLKLTENFPYMSQSIEELQAHITCPHNIMFLSRGFRNIIPSKDETLHKSDVLYFLIDKRHIKLLIQELGDEPSKLENILIVGGGNSGFYAAQALEKDYNVKVIEKDFDRASDIAEKLLNTTVINADAMNFKNLESANVSQMDVILNLTNSDEVNSLCSMFEKQHGVQVIHTLIKNGLLGALTNNMRFSHLVAPRDITVTQINKFIRDSKIYNLYSVQNGVAEVVELQVPYSCKIHGMSVQEVNQLGIGRIGAVINQKGVFFEKGVIVNSGDRIIALIPKETINDFYQLLH
jgi:trk system potassium uptake protein TrkA